MAIGRAVVYHARVALAFSAGIKCRHCTGVGEGLCVVREVSKHAFSKGGQLGLCVALYSLGHIIETFLSFHLLSQAINIYIPFCIVV